MAEIVKLPKLGLNMQEGTFVNWVKKVGDPVKTGEVLAEIESDKATIEIESTANGVLLKTLVDVGQTVPVGAPIAEIGVEGTETTSAAKAEQKEAPKQPAEVTQPAARTMPAKENGKSVVPAPAAVASENGGNLPGGVKASPVARKMAEERGIDLRLVKGTGPGGRIGKSDVESYQPGAQFAPTAQPGIAARPPAEIPTGPGITTEPITKLRRLIATRMVESKQTVPHFYVTSEIDMAAALDMRKKINDGLPEDQKVTVNDLVVKAAALALRKYRNLNSHYYGDQIVRYERINIGIAVQIDGGLINVVAKDADTTSISRLAQRNKQMIAAVRSGKVRGEDIEGSTFTVSNLGAYEVESFSAIINPPEAAILAVGSAQQVPVVLNGELKIGTRMKVTLSVDHRVSDGVEGAQYLQELKALLENPMRLLV
jgi:pyruvate dehydrogenase E2 component (dihydrolipoamide acetyltransferase)